MSSSDQDVMQSQIKQLREENQQMLAENQRLAEMCSWIIQAQKRSESGEVKVNDYLESQTDRVDLLKNSSFKMAYMDLIDGYQRGILNSQPDQSEVRELYYLKSQVLQELLHQINNQQKTIDTRKSLQNSREQKLQAVDS